MAALVQSTDAAFRRGEESRLLEEPSASDSPRASDRLVSSAPSRERVCRSVAGEDQPLAECPVLHHPNHERLADF